MKVFILSNSIILPEEPLGPWGEVLEGETTQLVPEPGVVISVETDSSTQEIRITGEENFPAEPLAKALLKKHYPVTIINRKLKSLGPGHLYGQAFLPALPQDRLLILLSDLVSELHRLTNNYSYIVECADGTYYTGWTNNLEKRMQAHASGKGCKYTKSHGFVRLVYAECHLTKQEAMQREWQIKHLSREKKRNYIKEWTNNLK